MTLTKTQALAEPNAGLSTNGRCVIRLAHNHTTAGSEAHYTWHAEGCEHTAFAGAPAIIDGTGIIENIPALRLSTSRDACAYYCPDCRQIVFSAVWEPTKIAAMHQRGTGHAVMFLAELFTGSRSSDTPTCPAGQGPMTARQLERQSAPTPSAELRAETHR